MPPAGDAVTRFAHLSRAQTAVAVACLLAFAVACLFSLRGVPLSIPNPTQQTDSTMYRRVIQRVHAGEGYYSALGAELRKGHYASRSVFNWRTPLHLMFIEAAGEPASHWVLAALAVLACILACLATNRAGGPGLLQVIVTGLALSNCFLFGLDFHLYSDVWAGVLMVISVSSYEFDWWPAGAATGILALFFRELAMPFVLVNLGFALWRRRRAEVVAWVAGLLLWAAYFLLHASAVRPLILPGDIPVAWMRLGGLHFILTTTLMSLLIGFPDWVAALFLPAMLFGLAGWKTGIGNRVAAVVAVYLAIYCVVGTNVNLYWGALTNPLLAFGLVWFLPAAIDVVRSLPAPRKARVDAG